MKTTKKQIVEWAMGNINSKDSMFGEEWSDALQKYVKMGECGYGVDASEMATHCWRCGHERETERCHVIPYSLGGEDVPSNYRLFCHDCHLQQPNVAEYSATDEWVRKTCVPYYNHFWKINQPNLEEKIQELIKKYYKQVTRHFGEKTLNDETALWLALKVYEEL
jgi:hypothetical protein